MHSCAVRSWKAKMLTCTLYPTHQEADRLIANQVSRGRRTSPGISSCAISRYWIVIGYAGYADRMTIPFVSFSSNASPSVLFYQLTMRATFPARPFPCSPLESIATTFEQWRHQQQQQRRRFLFQQTRKPKRAISRNQVQHPNQPPFMANYTNMEHGLTR